MQANTRYQQLDDAKRRVLLHTLWKLLCHHRIIVKITRLRVRPF